jgi:hypothetical protein
MTFHDSPNDIPDPEVVPKARRWAAHPEASLRLDLRLEY